MGHGTIHTDSQRCVAVFTPKAISVKEFSFSSHSLYNIDTLLAEMTAFRATLLGKLKDRSCNLFLNMFKYVHTAALDYEKE